MRIIKLSTTEFSQLEDVKNFFNKDLLNRTPIGKFRIPKGHIAENALKINEKLLFSYDEKIRYIALSNSKRINNQDEFKEKYLYYFQINMKTLKEIKPYSLSNFEEKYHSQTNETKKIARVQGWNIIEDNSFIENIWLILSK